MTSRQQVATEERVGQLCNRRSTASARRGNIDSARAPLSAAGGRAPPGSQADAGAGTSGFASCFAFFWRFAPFPADSALAAFFSAFFWAFVAFSPFARFPGFARVNGASANSS